MAAKADVKLSDEWFLGERKQFVFTVKDKAGAPVDISGWTMEWALMKKAGSVHLITKDTITVVDGPEEIANVAIVVINASDGAVLRADTPYYHELKRVDVGEEAVLAYGTATPMLSGI